MKLAIPKNQKPLQFPERAFGSQKLKNHDEF